LKAINVGLIGTGYMGKCHALAWNAVGPVFGDVPEIRLGHLGEANEELASRRAAELGFERWSGDWRSVVEDPEVDVVSITTPNALHADMAIAALNAGKAVWCEKPMAPGLDEALAMVDTARTSGKVAILGYNYIQNPAIRQIGRIIAAGRIGEVSHVRVEMDEDFMADPAAPFGWKSEAGSGYGALDDFAVHPLSLLAVLVAPIRRVMCDMARPYADRPSEGGIRKPVETYDIANVLLEFSDGASGVLCVNRSAWGRKGRIALQIYGSGGSILFDQEQMNQFALYTTDMPQAEQGYRTILTSPHHSPYGRFIPAPGHGLGFNDLKIIECRELIGRLRGEDGARVIDFDHGIAIERAVHAMAQSFRERRWVDLA